MVVLVELSPLDPTSGTRKTLRLAGADDSRVTGLNGQKWWPGVIAAPVLRMDGWDGSFASPADIAGASMQADPVALRKLDPASPAYRWAGAAMRVFQGEPGKPWAQWKEIFTGLVEDYGTDDAGRWTFSAKVDGEPFEARFPNATYAGTGAAEGDDNLKGKTKPAAFGRCRNVEPIQINAPNNVYQVHGYGSISAVSAVYERGADFVAEGGANIGDFATYAALVAATIPEGSWGTCLAQGMFRLGAPPTGLITADIDGDNSGVFVRTTSAIIARICSLSGVGNARIGSASLSALATAVPAPINLYMVTQQRLIDIVQALAQACNAQAIISWLGVLQIIRFAAIPNPAKILNGQGKARPAALGIQEVKVSPPFWRLEMRGERVWRPHSKDEIAFVDPVAGQSAYSFMLTNEQHTVPAENDGTVLSYDGAATGLRIFYGAEDVTGSFAVSGNSNPQGLTLSGTYPNYQVIDGFGESEDTASYTFIVTGTGQHAGVSLSKVFSLAKSKAPLDGVPPPLISLSADKLFAKYNKNDVYVGGAIKFTAIRQNIPGTQTYFKVIQLSDGALIYADTANNFGTGYGGAFAGSGGDVFVISANFVDAITTQHGTFRVEAFRDGYPVTDSVTIAKVKDGADGLNAPLVLTQYSADGTGGWDYDPGAGDYFARQSNDAGATWGPAYRFRGENATAVNGKYTSRVYLRSATVPAAPTDHTGDPPSGWNDVPYGVLADGFLWESQADIRDGIQITSWSPPVRIDGPAGTNGTDGFVVTASVPNFTIPCYSNGTSKPAWTGGTTTIRFQKGGVAITPDGGYSVPSQTGIATLSISGADVSFAGLTGDTGKFTVRATHGGIAYDSVVPVVKTKDGEAAFKGTTVIPPTSVGASSVQIGSGSTTVPAGRACVLSASVTYAIDPQIVGSFTGQLTLYWQNLTDSGPLNYLGAVTGSTAQLINHSSIPGEPDYEYITGIANASFAFTAPSPDKQIGFYAYLQRSSGNRSVIAQGGMSLEVSS